MIASISSSVLCGSVRIPPSKSAMQRACALALLNEGITNIFNPGYSNDDLTALDIIQQLGAVVEKKGESLVINSNGDINPPAILNCNESGLSLRMFTPIVSISTVPVTITGSGSLLKRPVDLFENYFSGLNVNAKTHNGFLPVEICGPMLPSDIEVDGSRSSQYLTGLLFAIAKKAEKLTVINVRNLVSRPYVDLSLHLLSHFGYEVENQNYSRFVVTPRVKKLRQISYQVESDWSSASFFIVAGLISGDLTLTGLDFNSCQSDKKILEVLCLADADFQILDDTLSVSNAKSLKAFQFDATDCPDLFPPLVVMALAAEGISIITGVGRLSDKESNRAMALVKEFDKLGAALLIEGDTMVIQGRQQLKGGVTESHDDHRIVMALSIAGLVAEGTVQVQGASSVDKSFPDFFKLLQQCGGMVTLQN